MIVRLIRSVGAILAGLFVAMVLVIAIEGIGAVVHPFPPGVDPTDLEVCKTHVAKCPQWFLGVVVAGWGGTVFASTWLATRLGSCRHPSHGIVVGSLLLAAVAYNMFLLPYRVWFEAANLLVFPCAIALAVKFASGRSAKRCGVEPNSDA